MASTYRGPGAIVSRSGYTGERGFEIWVSPDQALALWRDLLERGQALGIEPAGLGARDTLRLEMGYPLHGQDISEDRTPLEAGASWAVGLDKGDFPGREALLRQSAAELLAPQPVGLLQRAPGICQKGRQRQRLLQG